MAPDKPFLFGTDAQATLNDVNAFQGTIEGFSQSDSIILGSVPGSPSGIAILGAGNVLTVNESGESYRLQFDPNQDFSGETFALAKDGGWGTSVTLAPAGNNPTGPAEAGGPKFSYDDTTLGVVGMVTGQSYDGPLPGLSAQYVDHSADNAVIAADEPNVYILGGSGEDAILASSGNNVLASPASAAWFAGGSGTDSFYADAGIARPGWSTILNFHAGDNMMLWGFEPGASSYAWADAAGAPGHEGLTLESASPSGMPTYVTFAGLALSDLANITTSTGWSNGQSYLLVHHN